MPVSSVANNNTSSVDAISLKTMAQEAINRSVIDTNTLSQQIQATSLDNRQQQQQQQQQVLQQHFSSDTTANPHQQQQQQQTNTAAGLVASATASTNGPSTIGNTSTNSGSNIGSIGSNINASALNNAAGQQPIGAGASSATNKQQLSQQQQQQPTNEAHIPPLLGVAPLGPSPLQKEHQLQFQMMEAAYYHLPTPSDSEKLTTYFHRTPVQTPAHYPQVS